MATKSSRHIVIDARIMNSSTGRYVERLVHYLQEIDRTNHYTILLPTKDLGFFTPSNKNFSVKPADFKNYSFAEQTKFKTFLDELNADLVHFCMPQQPVLYKGTHVTTVHDLTLLNTYNSDKNWLVFHAKQLVGRYVFKKIAKTSSHIITPTQYVKDDYIRFANIPETKVTVTYEAADIFVDKIERYKNPFKRFLLYVGQQSDYKNIQKLGDAHQKLLDKYPDLGLILVGKKTPSHLKNETYFKSKDYKNILFTGFIEDPQRDWLFANCAVYTFPSLMEGFGLPALEAMGYGAPVASSNATCLPEVYGDAAHYFDPHNTDDIARAIDDILESEKLRKDLIKKGAKQIKKYSWHKMAEQTHTVYMNSLR
jgi:glycosyltransferase involved in cell wall biosynthesis